MDRDGYGHVVQKHMQEFAGRPAASTAYPPASPSAQTRVSTAATLQQAMQQGARHIVVEAHLDLSSLELVDFTGDSETPNYLLGIVRDTTRSITVRSWQNAGRALIQSLGVRCIDITVPCSSASRVL